MVKNREMNKIMLNIITEHGKKDGLNGFERVQKIHLISKSLMEYGVLTNTFKLQRHLAKNIFKKEI